MTLQRLVASYASDANDHQRQMFADSLHAALTLDEIRQLVATHGFDPATVRQTTDRHWTWERPLAKHCKPVRSVWTRPKPVTPPGSVVVVTRQVSVVVVTKVPPQCTNKPGPARARIEIGRIGDESHASSSDTATPGWGAVAAGVPSPATSTRCRGARSDDRGESAWLARVAGDDVRVGREGT
jgi:hypothetical protein